MKLFEFSVSPIDFEKFIYLYCLNLEVVTKFSIFQRD